MMSDNLKKTLGLIGDAGEQLSKVETKHEKQQTKIREKEEAAKLKELEEAQTTRVDEATQGDNVGEDDVEHAFALMLSGGDDPSSELGLEEEARPGAPVEDFELKEKESSVPEYVDSDINEDYTRTRAVAYSVQDACLVMMGRAMKLAAETENPRAFAVFSDLVSNVRGLNKDIMDIQKSVKDVTERSTPAIPPEQPEGGAQGATLTVPLGSNTANLLKMLEQAESDLENDNAALDGDIEDAEIS